MFYLYRHYISSYLILTVLQVLNHKYILRLMTSFLKKFMKIQFYLILLEDDFLFTYKYTYTYIVIRILIVIIKNTLSTFIC